MCIRDSAITIVSVLVSMLILSIPLTIVTLLMVGIMVLCSKEMCIRDRLKIKPVIELKDGILVKLGVARGMRKGKDFLFREYEACEIDEEWPVVTGYTYDRESGEKFRQEVQERYHLARCV